MDANSLAGHAVFIRRGLALLRSVRGLSSGLTAKQKEFAMKSLFQKSLVTTGLVAAMLALAGNAMAANVYAKTRATAAQTTYVDVAARSPYSYPYRSGKNFAAGPGIDVGRLIAATLGGLPPQYAGIVQNAIRASASHRSVRASASHRYSGSSASSGSYDPGPSSSPSPDPSPPPAGPDTAGMNTSTNPTWPAIQ